MNRKPTVIREAATVVFYRPTKNARGWYVRNYHSTYAMDAHLKHLAEGAPPPRHWRKPKGWNWESSFGDTGPFTSKADAMEWALPPAL
jgi:hypothetical protein